MSIRASPVVVRCLSCSAAVDRSVAGTCPFCGTDVASMPVIEAEPESAASPQVTALAVVPKPLPRRRRRWRVLLVFAAATAAAFVGRDAGQVRTASEPVRLPSVAIPVLTTQPVSLPAEASATPSPTAAVPGAEATAAAHAGCDFFATQEIDREYSFERARADLKLQRARENNDHVFRIGHDRKAFDARAKAAAEDHAATISALDRRLTRARSSCDASLVFG